MAQNRSLDSDAARSRSMSPAAFSRLLPLDPLPLLDPLLLPSMACIRSLATESAEGTPW